MTIEDQLYEINEKIKSLKEDNNNLDDYLLDKGQIFISGEIDYTTYLDVSKKLRYCFYKNISPVKIYINSTGGVVEDALGIIDEFKLFEQNDKEIYCIGCGQVCSSAAIILGFGTQRFATESTTLLLHPISYDLGNSEHQSAKSYVIFAEKLYNNIMINLALKCGRKTPKELQKFIDSIRNGYWMDCDSALEFGLIHAKWNYSLE